MLPIFPLPRSQAIFAPDGLHGYLVRTWDESADYVPHHLVVSLVGTVKLVDKFLPEPFFFLMTFPQFVLAFV
jgi:hypothetical protein